MLLTPGPGPVKVGRIRHDDTAKLPGSLQGLDDGQKPAIGRDDTPQTVWGAGAGQARHRRRLPGCDPECLLLVDVDLG